MSSMYMTQYPSFMLVNEQGAHEFQVQRYVPDGGTDRKRDVLVDNVRIGTIFKDADGLMFQAKSITQTSSAVFGSFEQAVKWVADKWFTKHPARQARKQEFGLGVRA